MGKTQPRPKLKLCVLCIAARDDPYFRQPTHLVELATYALMLYDVHGEAMCPGRAGGARDMR